MMNDCKTNRDTVTCTFTNTHKFPATTCVKGLLYQKEASGVRLQALPMCTGRLMPAETKTVSLGLEAVQCARDTYTRLAQPCQRVTRRKPAVCRPLRLDGFRGR